MPAPLQVQIQNLQRERNQARAENERLREALTEVLLCCDGLPPRQYVAELARAALRPDKGGNR